MLNMKQIRSALVTTQLRVCMHLVSNAIEQAARHISDYTQDLFIANFE